MAGEAERQKIELESKLGQSVRDAEMAAERYEREQERAQKDLNEAKSQSTGLRSEIETLKSQLTDLEAAKLASHVEMEKVRAG